MANTIKIKRTSTPSSAPSSLEYGELAINYADGKIFYKNSSNQITQFSSGQKTTTSTTAPASPALGDLWFESDTGKTFIYYDSFWVEVCGALVAASSDGTTTLTTKGDLLSRSSGGLARLGVGTNGYFLKANSATATGLEWGAIPTVSILDDVGDVIITSATSGDILKWNGSNWVNDSALLAAKAPLASPALTGTPSAPTAAVSTNTTQIATTAFVRAEVSALVGGATATLDTLGEIATALGNDANLSTTLTSSIALKAPLASPTFTGTVTIPSGASISGFAPLASPTFTGTVSGITATMVGLGNVDNTADTAKPVSTAQQTALNLKADLASPTLTGTPIAPTAAGGTNTTQIATTAFVTTAVSGATITSLDDVADVTITSNSSGNFLKWNGTAWVNDAIDLGTDTTGSYVTSLVAGTGVTLAGNSGEGATPTVTVDTTVIQARVANVTDTEIGYLDGVTSAIQTQIDTKLASSTAGTTYAPLASPTFTGTVTIPSGASISGFAPLASPTFTGTATLNNVTVSGDLTVSGTTTSINTETLTVDDNIIILNNNATGAPSQDAGIEIERGTSTNVQIRWNETTDKWQFTNDGTTYNDLGAGGATISDTPPASPVTGQLWYESDTGLAYVYYDSFWVEIGGGSAYDTVINTIQAKGDLLAGTASQTLDRLTVGTNNQRLIANSSATTGLAWANDTTNTVIDTKGDLLVGATNDVVAKLTVGTDNQVLVANSSATNGLAWVDQPTGFRNVFINGDMRIAQRGTSATSLTASSYPTCDRWEFNLSSAGTWTATQSTDAPTGFSNSLKVQCTTANASLATTNNARIWQKIEGFNVQQFAKGTADAKPLVLTFWVKSFQTGTFICTLDDLTNTRKISASYTINASATWEKKTLSFAGDTTGALANSSSATLMPIWWVAAGPSWQGSALSTSWSAGATLSNYADGQTNVASSTNNYFQITGVQLEANTMATPFEQRPYGAELALCFRYYQRIVDPAGSGVANAASQATRVLIPLYTKMRATPTTTISGTVNFWNGGSTGGATALLGTYNSVSHGQLDFVGGVGSAGQAVTLYTTGGSQYLDFSAEL